MRHQRVRVSRWSTAFVQLFFLHLPFLHFRLLQQSLLLLQLSPLSLHLSPLTCASTRRLPLVASSHPLIPVASTMIAWRRERRRARASARQIGVRQIEPPLCAKGRGR